MAEMGELEKPPDEKVQIRVRGQLDPSWSNWLGGLTISVEPDGNTLLTGQVVDQPALQGILSKLYAMNLHLLSLKVNGEPV
jgi:hypothetical protein